MTYQSFLSVKCLNTMAGTSHMSVADGSRPTASQVFTMIETRQPPSTLMKAMLSVSPAISGATQSASSNSTRKGSVS